jgi:hypothetical protein
MSEFNTPVPQTDRTPRLNLKIRVMLHYQSNGQQTSTEYSILHQIIYILLIGSWKIHCILSHKATLNKCLKTKIIFCILSDHNGIKLEISSKENYRNNANT